MNKRARDLTRMFIAGLCLGGNLAAGEVLVSPYREFPPVLDGIVGWGEWWGAATYSLDHGYLAVAHDNLRLYLLLNMTDDTGDDPCGSGPGSDYFWLTFDRNRDGEIDSGDRNYAMEDGTGNLGRAVYSGPGAWGALQTANIFSALAKGYGCFFWDGSYRHYLPPLAPVCKQHRVWELAIDLSEIGVDVYGGTTQRRARMGLRVASPNPAFTNEAPAGFTTNFSELIEIRMDRAPEDAPVTRAGVSIQFDESLAGIEVVQAVQTRSNTLGLVEGKATAARVYVRNVGGGTTEPARIYLFGRRNGTNLPASPLAQWHAAPAAINRDRFRGSANFQLPASWCTGTVEVAARARWGVSGSTAPTPVTVAFQPGVEPVMWVIPVRVVYEGQVSTYSGDRIANRQSYMETVFPVPGIRYVRRPWQVLGEFTSPSDPAGAWGEWGHFQVEILHALREYYYQQEAAYAVRKKPPFPRLRPPFPDQIMGILPRGGQADSDSGNPAHGISPGCHHVSTIGLASKVSVMAHETVHNLDTAVPTTWGEHLCEAEIPWVEDNCGADGCDTAWPWPDPFVHETGFDTRRPWVEPYDQPVLNQNDRFTVISGTPEVNFTPNPYAGHEGEFEGWTNGFVDFMSYCASSAWRGGEYNPNSILPSPPRWISAYRWEILRDYYAAPGGGGRRADGKTAGETQTVYYGWGTVHSNGPAALDPVFILPGYASRAPSPGPYALEVQDANGAALATLAFQLSFVDGSNDDEEHLEPVAHESARFHFQIPAKPDAARIVLKKDGQVLASRVRSANAPTVQVLIPNGGEQWTGTQNIQWSATDNDGDALAAALFYSPDGGDYWVPVAWGLQGQSYQVDTETLPGGTNGRLRVVVTDGFLTAEDDNDGPFTLPNQAPETAVVLAPTNNAVLPANQPVDLEALAHDREEGLPPEGAYVWSYGTNIIATGRRVTVFLPLGLQGLTLTVYDSEGLSNQTAIAITTVDATPPAIDLLGENPVVLEAGTAYVEPGYAAADNVDGDLTGQVQVSGPTDMTAPGSYLRRYNVADGAGNPAPERTRHVEVRSIALQGVAFDGAVQPTIRWQSATGSQYRIFTTGNLLGGWQPAGEVPSAGDSTGWTDTNPPQNQKHYQIRRVLP